MMTEHTEENKQESGICSIGCHGSLQLQSRAPGKPHEKVMLEQDQREAGLGLLAEMEGKGFPSRGETW